MKKKILYIVFSFLSFLSFIGIINAATYQGTFTHDLIAVRSGPGTNYTKLTTYSSGKTIDLVDNNLYKNEGGCAAGWYKFYYGTTVAYSCSSYIRVTEIGSPTQNEDAKAPEDVIAKIKADFPESYWSGLIALATAHPKWSFEAINTNLDWKNAVAAESYGSISLINTKTDGYKSTAQGSYNWLTDTWTVFDGTSWVAAHPDVVAYYMDPRNFLYESKIWMFEKLNFDASYQTTSSIAGVFTESSYLRNYTATFYEGGKTYDINPIYLGARVRQETGNNGGTATSGAAFTYQGKTYSGVYNMYNIGATSGSDAVYKGLVWAAGGSDGSAKTYLRPWTSREQSIKGGANFIASSYIAQGQYTNYLQRFNLVPKNGNPYTHQYMTNIQAVDSESSTTYNAYKNNDMLNIDFKFSIPVFINMPTSTSLPNTGNPNHRLKDLRINDKTINGFRHDINTYDYYVSTSASSVTIAGTVVNAKATTAGFGTINLTADKTVAKIIVKAENGTTNTYTVNIIKTASIEMSVDDIISSIAIKCDGTNLSGIPINSTKSFIATMVNKVAPNAMVEIKSASGSVKTTENLATGDIARITNNGETKEYKLIIYGDIDGNGKIDVTDLLMVQKHILGASKLTGVYLKAADNNQDGVITVIDLLRTQKHILGLITIS